MRNEFLIKDTHGSTNTSTFLFFPLLCKRYWTISKYYPTQLINTVKMINMWFSFKDDLQLHFVPWAAWYAVSARRCLCCIFFVCFCRLRQSLRFSAERRSEVSTEPEPAAVQVRCPGRQDKGCWWLTETFAPRGGLKPNLCLSMETVHLYNHSFRLRFVVPLGHGGN